jgi:hypothetical protein
MMVYAMRRLAWSAGGWCASTRFDTSMARCRSCAAKMSSAARVSTPALSGCSGKLVPNFTPASMATLWASAFSAAGNAASYLP